MVKATSQASASAAPLGAPPNFESALQELEGIVHAMETGEAPLEETLAAYERGMVLLKHCQETLASAERKLQILENGVLRDFDADGDSSQES